MSAATHRVGMTVGGKYVLRRVLGVGGMGTVYEALHAYTNRRVALKLLGPDFASSDDAVARFLQEAQAPSSIGHPNIVEVLDAGEDPAVGLYVVLEYLEGEDFEGVVERGDIDMPRLVDLTLQLLDALDAAHQRGFVHRDIKPANVFLTEHRDGSLRVKLLDFGIAKNIAQGITVGNVVMGTPHYMAPEQAQGKPVDGRADLWAVGAMLYHALSGAPVHDGDNANVIMVSIIVKPPPSLAAARPDLSPVLHEVVARALQKDLAARWASASDMAALLRTAPERLPTARTTRITSTLRNRGGAADLREATGPARLPSASELVDGASRPPTAPRSIAPPRGRAVTLDVEHLEPGSPPIRDKTLMAGQSVSLDPARHPSVVRGVRAPSAVAAALLVVAAVVALFVAATRGDGDTRPPAVPVVSTHAATHPAAPSTAPSTAPVSPLVADDIPPPADVAAPVEATLDDRHGRGHRGGRHHGHDDTAAPSAATPAAAPAAPSAAPHRVGGLTIGGYEP